jgi:putative transposase
MARSVNQVWNFCKETQITALKRQDARFIEDRKTGEKVAIPNFFSAYELNNLTSGSGPELGLHSQSVQAVCEEYVRRRKQFKKLLRWRGRKSLGWIPFKKVGIQLKEDHLIYAKQKFRFWNSRSLPQDAVIKTGAFVQDARGRWSVCVTFKSEELRANYAAQRSENPVTLGLDLGIKTLATASDGVKIERPDLRGRYLAQVRKLERQRRFARRQQVRSRKFGALPKDRQMRALQARVKNQRQDYLHKQSTQLVRRARGLVVGDLRCGFMNRSKTLSGISLDSGIGMFKNMLRYKSKRDGVGYEEVSERDSTQTCSNCGWRHPKGERIGLGVREWDCPGCQDHHDRDINAAKNILRMGHHALTCPAV